MSREQVELDPETLDALDGLYGEEVKEQTIARLEAEGHEVEYHLDNEAEEAHRDSFMREFLRLEAHLGFPVPAGDRDRIAATAVLHGPEQMDFVRDYAESVEDRWNSAKGKREMMAEWLAEKTPPAGAETDEDQGEDDGPEFGHMSTRDKAMWMAEEIGTQQDDDGEDEG